MKSSPKQRKSDGVKTIRPGKINAFSDITSLDLAYDGGVTSGDTYSGARKIAIYLTLCFTISTQFACIPRKDYHLASFFLSKRLTFSQPNWNIIVSEISIISLFRYKEWLGDTHDLSL